MHLMIPLTVPPTIPPAAHPAIQGIPLKAYIPGFDKVKPQGKGCSCGHQPLDLKLEHKCTGCELRTQSFAPPLPRHACAQNKALHGEQYMQLFAPIPASGELRTKPQIVDIRDKGKVRGGCALPAPLHACRMTSAETTACFPAPAPHRALWS